MRLRSARWFRAVIALTVLASALAVPGPVTAATYRSHVARTPETPTSQQAVRVWMQSDTAHGETAGVEYNVGDSYIKVLGTFDVTTQAGANWRASIPPHANGITVRYQLFTRNQWGQDYGFTGFDWSYTVDDGDIRWDGLKHDTFDAYYRSPFGAVEAGTPVTLRFRTERFDVDAVSVRIYAYSAATNSTSGPTDYPMSYLEDRVEGGTTYAIWTLTLPTPGSPSILYYKFRVTDRLDVDWYSDAYADDHDNVGQGGVGATTEDEPFPSFQLSVHRPGFQTPAWLQDANVYQIFPDRFRNGDPTNDPCRPGSSAGCPTFYGNQTPILHTTWNAAICDPRGAACPNAYGTQFYGGDLQGIEQKLGHLQAAGFDTLYLTPIFSGRSNHRYDTDDYLHVDPSLGGDAAFTSLVRAMEQRGMKLIVDGVFNHTSSDSVYFDRYGRYASDGACESLGSTYRSWYEFHNSDAPCDTGDYAGWFGYDSLAVLQDGSAAVRDFIYRSGAQNVVQHWYLRGVDGWRFDVADEISHDWWRDFRPYAKGDDPEGPLVGEVWPDASRFLLGDQLDSAMNYRFRKNLLGFARGVGWRDNDNNGSNEIVGLTPSQFDHALRSVREDYPDAATRAMFNLIDSHDTNRALYVLTLLGDSGLTEAKQRLTLSALFQFTYLGAPTVYYGDEVALDSPSTANGVNGPEDDPYNRAPYPWADEPGSTDIYGPADGAVAGVYAKLAHARKQYPTLRSGAFATLLTGDTTASASDNGTYAFARSDAGQTAVVALNQAGGSNTASIPVGAYFANGTTLTDLLTETTYTVSGGAVSLTLAPRTGVLLVPGAASADVTAPTATATAQGANANGFHSAAPVTVDLAGADVGSGVKELRYWVDNGPVTVVAGDAGSVQVSTDGTVVSVRAIDHAGNASSVASVTVRIDGDAPDTSITTAPSGTVATTSASVSFSSTDPQATFECTLDGAAFAACTSPVAYNGLADGEHTVSVRAVDLAGNADTSPATASWTVDTTPAETTIDDGPPTLTNAASATFAFSSETSATFTCSLDGGPATDCSSPVTLNGLSEGPHTFSVRAADAVGNEDPTPAIASWTVDTEAPETSITSGPPAATTATGATFGIASSETGSTFECRIDGGAYAACSDPVTYSGLGVGSHTFEARATDAAGNTDPTPASHAWTVRDVYAFAGYFGDVDPRPTVNRMKAGRSVDITFSLGGDRGLAIFSSAPTAAAIACPTGPRDHVEGKPASGPSTLTYDASTGRYTFRWSTDGAWRKSCRELVLSFEDGSEQRLLWEFNA